MYMVKGGGGSKNNQLREKYSKILNLYYTNTKSLQIGSNLKNLIKNKYISTNVI